MLSWASPIDLQVFPMRGSTLVLAPTALAVGLLLAGCGSNTEQRSSTGALTGIGVGAVVGGPVGAVVGGVVGGIGGAAAPEGADQLADSAIHKEKTASQNALNKAGLGPNASSPRVEDAQRELQREGLYHGKIDGIAGPDTRQAITAFQQREGLRQTSRLDDETMDRLDAAGTEATGSSEPPAPPPSNTNAPNH
jgi:peptidoglycan hydrolase-like protein with peptidoglycan-binding domain